MTGRKKLIEVALPLDAINKASAREKSIRHGHPSTLHLWWARRPLAAARAVIFAQMVDDPSSCPDLFPTEKAQEKERQRLFKIIEELVQWENTTNESVLEKARAEIWQSWRRACAENVDHPRAKELFDRYKLPAFHDPFAGGGALPLEAQRLGLEAYASDLNPVAVLINKAMIEIPPKFAGKPPVNPASRAKYLGTRASRPHKLWHSRGYLPHFDQPGLLQSITFRLHDSLPRDVVERWKQELGWREEMSADDTVAVELRQRIARFEDEGHGHCWLAREDIGRLVQEALLHFDGERYRVLAWCVMPNHVHVVIETGEGYPLGDVVHSWKSFTAKEANKLLERSGDFWMPDYHDRFIRDADHLAAVIAYVENNPVEAGLVRQAEEWQISSASAARGAANKAGETPALPGIQREWRGAQGLAEDVRYYGQWMRDEAVKRIGHLYPTIEVTAQMAQERLDLKPLVGRTLTVIAWLWARTVKSPNPAFAQVDVPLASTFMLSTKAGKEVYVEPVIEPGSAAILAASSAGGTPTVPGYRFTVKVGKPKDAEAAKNGTKLSRGANFRCLMSGTPMAVAYIKSEGMAGRMGARLMAIVAEGDRGRIYLSPNAEHERVAVGGHPTWAPDQEIAYDPHSGATYCVLYGLTRFKDLFTSRQLVALTTFSDLVQEARERMIRDGREAGLLYDEKPLTSGGTGATGYADAVAVYLAFALSKQADLGSNICAWEPIAQCPRHVFGRQAIPMVWDFAEGNPLGFSSGAWVVFIDGIAKAFAKAFEFVTAEASGSTQLADARWQELSNGKVVSTDPPYYDNVPYADLSDFFYVWMRCSLKFAFPDLVATLAVPKTEELVAFASRHGGKGGAEAFFLAGMTQAMHRVAEQTHPAFPVTIYYAFKQSEGDGRDGTTNTGWDTFLAAVIEAGFAISGTWPMRTENDSRMVGQGTNALASSIVLVCRPRTADASTATRREFVTTLKAELPVALAHLQRGNIAPVDLAQAAIGPGMAVYTRYSKVLDAEGKALTVREALALINQTLDEALAEQEGDFDADSRWAVAWFEQAGFAEGEFGVADVLARAKNTSVAGMVEAGILTSGRGKVRLLKPSELPGSAGVSPAFEKKISGQDGRAPRLTAWEMVHHLIRSLEAGGEGAAADLVAKLGSKAEIARELAYRLYTLCERKKRAPEALSYNGLVQSWPEITRLARQEPARPEPTTGRLL